MNESRNGIDENARSKQTIEDAVNLTFSPVFCHPSWEGESLIVKEETCI